MHIPFPLGHQKRKVFLASLHPAHNHGQLAIRNLNFHCFTERWQIAIRRVICCGTRSVFAVLIVDNWALIGALITDSKTCEKLRFLGCFFWLSGSCLVFTFLTCFLRRHPYNNDFGRCVDAASENADAQKSVWGQSYEGTNKYWSFLRLTKFFTYYLLRTRNESWLNFVRYLLTVT